MEALRKGSKGTDVTRWQLFLRGQGHPIVADGEFGPKTHAATRAFQKRHSLATDGIVGNRTLGKAMTLGLCVVDDDTTGKHSPNWPPAPKNLKPLTSNRERHRRYGHFKWKPAPTPSNPERIRILGSWARDNIVRIELPQLLQVGRKTARVWVHREAATPLQALWGAWEAAGLLGHIRSWNGSYVARTVRGSKTTLSNHAFGTAFDINARWNRLGAAPALVGETGSVRELVPLANRHGFYWGGHYRRRPDGMHFELAG